MPTPEGPSLCWFHVGFLEPRRRGGRRDIAHPALVATDEGQGSDYRVTGPGRRPPCATHPTEGPRPLGPDRGAWAQQLCPPHSFHQSQMMVLRAETEEQEWDRTSHLKQTAGSKEQGPEGWEPRGRPIYRLTIVRVKTAQPGVGETEATKGLSTGVCREAPEHAEL